MIIIFGNSDSSSDDDVCLTSLEGRFNFADMVGPYAFDCLLLGYHSYGDIFLACMPFISSSLACRPYSLISASFRSIACTDLFYAAQSVDTYQFHFILSSLTTLILVFLLFFSIHFPQKYFPFHPIIRHSYQMTSPF